jgi:hypothetical protein
MTITRYVVGVRGLVFVLTSGKVAVVFTSVAGVAIVMFFVGQVSLYSPIRE